MPKQKNYLTQRNDLCLESNVKKREHFREPEIGSGLIHMERELQWLRAKIKLSEERLAAEGPLIHSPEELLEDIKKALRENK